MKVWKLFLGVLWVLGWVGTTHSQSNLGYTLQANSADLSQFPAVQLNLTVRDANGVPVSNLTPAEFEILESSIDQPRPVTALTPQVNPQAPISVVLVIDISNSMRGQPLADAKQAAVNLINQLGANDQAAVVAFESSINFDQLDPAKELDFTQDKTALLTLINSLEAGEGTPLYDALYKGVRLTDRTDLGYRAVILLTDGVDETPGSVVATKDTPAGEAQRANLPIFTIGLGERTDPNYLKVLAERTGGTYQYAPTSADLLLLFQNIIFRLKQQYLLTYSSGFDCDGLTHRVEVLVKVAGGEVSDGLEFGPLEVRPGCNGAAVAVVDEGSEAAEVVEPSPTAVVEVVVLPTLAPEVTATAPAVVVVPPAGATPEPVSGILAGPALLTACAFLLTVAIVGSLTMYGVTKRRGGPVCNNCGYRWPRGGAVSCPQCGSTDINFGMKR